MKINITKNDARFIVDEKKGKVVCIIDGTRGLFLHYAEDNFRIRPDCDSEWSEDSGLFPKLLMPNRYVGVATCNPEDTFSIETGKLIAFSNAKDKIHKSFFKRANTYVNTLDNWLTQAVDSINRYGEKIEFNTQRRHDKITELVGEPN